MLEKAVFVFWHAIAYFLRNLRGGALERINVTEPRYGFGVLDPGKELLVRNDPDCEKDTGATG